jgi:quercetin dioxygenase-like cupin family protein
MAEQKTREIAHEGLAEAERVLGRGPGSKVFHLEDVPELVSVHDGRRKRVLLNSTNTGGELLVDVVTVAPGSSSPVHFQRGTEHFFYVLAGRGRIRIGDREFPLRAGSVAWVAEGDIHQLLADPDCELAFLEYFSRGRHETVFLGPACTWRPEEAR